MLSTTAGQLIEFLKQYPEDANIEVLAEVQGAWTKDTKFEDLDLDRVEILDLRNLKHISETDPMYNKISIRFGHQ
jgi:hypothetical protein